ncbi:hypothetical protein FA740_12970 [Paracoccus hibiscisoli]|uniref:Uncharacterized protein n=1 Tax=Paracoccus hibiscisoli TaxID=2023261 RepID=A0A4U0R5H7_9RHOB|nr:hypothetical protein FA740_12970 [Paracoccus hibiscisoli]
MRSGGAPGGCTPRTPRIRAPWPVPPQADGCGAGQRGRSPRRKTPLRWGRLAQPVPVSAG